MKSGTDCWIGISLANDVKMSVVRNIIAFNASNPTLRRNAPPSICAGERCCPRTRASTSVSGQTRMPHSETGMVARTVFIATKLRTKRHIARIIAMPPSVFVLGEAPLRRQDAVRPHLPIENGVRKVGLARGPALIQACCPPRSSSAQMPPGKAVVCAHLDGIAADGPSDAIFNNSDIGAPLHQTARAIVDGFDRETCQPVGNSALLKRPTPPT